MGYCTLHTTLKHWTGLLVTAFMFTITVNAQPIITLQADSQQILIGDFLNVRMRVQTGEDVKSVMPVVKGNLGMMDVVREEKTDTIRNGSQTEYVFRYLVSAYDSGNYLLGPALTIVTYANGQNDTLLSDYALVRVNTLDIDTAQPFKAIKPELEVPYLWKEFTYYYIAIAVLIALIVVLYLLWKKYKQRPAVKEERFTPAEPAHVWARKELKKLEDEKLWQQGEVKAYYSRLSDILRYYLEYRYQWFAMESTTDEIRTQKDLYQINDIAADLLLSTLQNADLAKFAKVTPLPDVNTRSLQNAYEFVEMTKMVEPDKNTNS